jgi:uncharacterized membrane protein YeiB
MSLTDAAPAEVAAPTPRGGRIIGYDLARALAIGGMVLVHFALVMGGPEPPPGWPKLLLHALDGRAAALFVLLAGIGVSLRASAGDDRETQTRQRAVLIRRGFFLLVVGFVNLTIWSGDILRVYGVSMILAAFLFRARTRTLLALAAAFVAGFVLLLVFVDYDTHWNWATLHYRGLWTVAGVVRNLFYDGFRAVFPWTGLLLIGMCLGRLDVSSPATRRRLLVWGASVAIGAEVASAVAVRAWLAAPRHPDAETVRALVGTDSMPPLPLFLLAAGGAAVAVMAACLIVATARPRWRVVRALVATGQMAFTWYVAHILLGLGFVVAMGWDRAASAPLGLLAGMAFFGLAVAVSTVWKSFVRHGPLEWLLRRVAG